MKLLTRLEKSTDCWFLIGIIFIFFVLRLPSLFEPYWYGDEAIYQVIGMGLNEDRLLYRDIWDNKPPLLYILYALFSSDQFTIRSVSLLFGVSAVVAFFGLAKKLFKEAKMAVFFSTGFFAFLFAIPLLEGNIANAENFMLFPIILAGLLIYNATNHTLTAHRYTLMAGFLLSLAFLFKVVAIFDFAAFFLFLVFATLPPKQIAINKLLIFILSFAIPILTTIVFFLAKGAFWDFIEAVFRQNVSYVGYGNALFLPAGLLLIKLILLTSAIMVIFLKRKTLHNYHLFILLWFIFSLFNAFFSQRPYTHYLLTLLPSFILMFGLLFQEKKYQKIIIISLCFGLFFIFANFTFFGKTARYYQNYLAFISGQKSVSSYQGFFDRNTPIDYAVVSFLKTHKKADDQIFVWGNNAQIYVLLETLPPGRYTVAYHISASKTALLETQEILTKTKPKYLVVSAEPATIPFSLVGYTPRITIYHTYIYERVF
ncbi:MAG: glycosyltransferase family 39 protein [Candidatus Levybacteria bacterium]|nr:glycosyltransferase family 39 protein [Candidatus Levybacteria bacterium]